jgi:formate dehydrogenase major subunit
MWHYKAAEPLGMSRNMGEMFVEIMNRVKALYAKEGGAFPEPILKADYPETFDAEAVARRINGVFTTEVTVGKKTYKRGPLVPGFPHLKDDGSTTSMNWLYCSGYTEEEGNLAKRRDLTQTPMQARIGLYPGFAWACDEPPSLQRARWTRTASPSTRQTSSLAGRKWIGDVPDGATRPWPRRRSTPSS